MKAGRRRQQPVRDWVDVVMSVFPGSELATERDMGPDKDRPHEPTDPTEQEGTVIANLPIEPA